MFQYDVVLHVGSDGGVEPVTAIEWLDWCRGRLTPGDLEQRLQRERPVRLGIRGVPNARVAEASRAVDEPDGAGALGTAVAPAAVWAMGRALGYVVDVLPSPAGPLCFDASFTREGAGARRAIELPAPRPGRPWREYANDPSLRSAGADLVSGLRRSLRWSLPDAMVPADFVILPALPRTATGKLDRRALPAPPRHAPPAAGGAPRTELEAMIAGIWRRLLGVERIGARDNFFDLGGHSLLAAQAANALSRAIGVEVPLRLLFESPTVCELGVAVEALRAAARAAGDEAAHIADMVRGLSDEQAEAWLAELGAQATEDEP
jgi:hypothetical protein